MNSNYLEHQSDDTMGSEDNDYPMVKKDVHYMKLTYNYTTHDLETNGYYTKFCLTLDVRLGFQRNEMLSQAQLVREV